MIGRRRLSLATAVLFAAAAGIGLAWQTEQPKAPPTGNRRDPGFFGGVGQKKEKGKKDDDENARAVAGIVQNENEDPVEGAIVQLKDSKSLKVRSYITKAAIVRNDQLAVFARHLKLGDALRLGHGEYATGGSHRAGLLGSTFEAVIGALYLDSGLGSVEALVNPLLEDVRESVLTKIHDPKSQLQEWAQAQKMSAPRYHTVSMTGPDHAKEFEVEVLIGERVVGKGVGTSKHTAQQTAAQNAIDELELKS